MSVPHHTITGYNVLIDFSKFLLISIIICINAICINVNADPIENDNPSVIREIKLAMDAFYRMDIEQSENIIDEAIKKYPDNSLLYLVKGGFYLERFRFKKSSNDEDNRVLKENILFLNKKVIALAGKRIKSDPHDIAAQYFLGAGHGNIGRFYLINGQWLKGFLSGRKGFKLCEKVVNNDPDYYDAYLGIGIFHYFAATIPKVAKALSFLLGMPDGDKERGIKEIKFVRDNSQVLSIEARRILLRIARWEENWQEFYTGSRWLAEHYPENVYFQVFYIYALTHDDQFKEARHQLNKVNTLIENNPDQLPIPIRVRYFRYSGFLSFHLEEYSNAVKRYLDAINLSKNKKSFKRIWAEDYYFLAASYARLIQKKEALIYLQKSITNGRKKETVIKQPEWEPFIEDREFIRITEISN